MKNRDVYELALNLLAEPIKEGRTDDYLTRAPYLLGSFFYENSGLDDSYREAYGLDKRSYTHAVCVNLDDDFPFVERFAPLAGYYLASTLVIDDDEALGDKFFDLFSASVSKLISEIPASADGILNVY